MRRFWYRRILIMLVVFTISVGGIHYYIEYKNTNLKQKVSVSTSESIMVIPGGMPIGIYMETNGVMVLGTGEIVSIDGKSSEPAKHLVKPGDYITQFNGKKISSKKELTEAIRQMHNENVVLGIRRKGEAISIRFKAVEYKNKVYKLGIWIRDNAQGLGTITYLTTESKYGALGHGIHDIDTNQLLEISNGKLYTTNIKNIQKGENGNPGGIEGIIVYNNYNILGSIEKNTEVGIYGTINRIDTIFTEQTPIEVGAKEEIKKGSASIMCAVEGKVKEYEVEIEEINYKGKKINKGLLIEITDAELLEITGGIVQGMSGSPIIQDGKLVGAVTHVLVNDPTRGYGIFIENMLEAAK